MVNAVQGVRTVSALLFAFDNLVQCACMLIVDLIHIIININIMYVADTS